MEFVIIPYLMVISNVLANSKLLDIPSNDDYNGMSSENIPKPSRQNSLYNLKTHPQQNDMQRFLHNVALKVVKMSNGQMATKLKRPVRSIPSQFVHFVPYALPAGLVGTPLNGAFSENGEGKLDETTLRLLHMDKPTSLSDKYDWLFFESGPMTSAIPKWKQEKGEEWYANVDWNRDFGHENGVENGIREIDAMNRGFPVSDTANVTDDGSHFARARRVFVDEHLACLMRHCQPLVASQLSNCLASKCRRGMLTFDIRRRGRQDKRAAKRNFSNDHQIQLQNENTLGENIPKPLDIVGSNMEDAEDNTYNMGPMNRLTGLNHEGEFHEGMDQVEALQSSMALSNAREDPSVSYREAFKRFSESGQINHSPGLRTSNSFVYFNPRIMSTSSRGFRFHASPFANKYPHTNPRLGVPSTMPQKYGPIKRLSLPVQTGPEVKNDWRIEDEAVRDHVSVSRQLMSPERHWRLQSVPACGRHWYTLCMPGSKVRPHTRR